MTLFSFGIYRLNLMILVIETVTLLFVIVKEFFEKRVKNLITQRQMF